MSVSRISYGLTLIIAGLAVLGGETFSAQDKYSLKVPKGLAFSEFRDTKTGRLSPSTEFSA
jgi:hypothetical protein